MPTLRAIAFCKRKPLNNTRWRLQTIVIRAASLTAGFYTVVDQTVGVRILKGRWPSIIRPKTNIFNFFCGRLRRIWMGVGLGWERMNVAKCRGGSMILNCGGSNGVWSTTQANGAGDSPPPPSENLWKYGTVCESIVLSSFSLRISEFPLVKTLFFKIWTNKEFI